MSSFQQEELFVQACWDGDIATVERMIGTVDINCRDSEDRTGLIMASHNSRFDIVVKLLDHGADVTLEDTGFWDALNYTLCRQPFQPQIAKLLLSKINEASSNRQDSKINKVSDVLSNPGINKLGVQDYLETCSGIDAFKFVVDNGADINRIRSRQTAYDTVFERFRWCQDEDDKKDLQETIDYLRSIGAKSLYELEPDVYR